MILNYILQDIPEETLWRNDFILRNNFKVLLHERNTTCKVKVILNNPTSTQLEADYVWQVFEFKDSPFDKIIMVVSTFQL